MRKTSSHDKIKYVVYSRAYSESSGGGIWLHNLVHTLNELGESAFLWPFGRSLPHVLSPRWLRGELRLLYGKFAVNSALQTPVASPFGLDDATVVVYPEIVVGNPLRARNVVRWLLYNPELRPELVSRDRFGFGLEDRYFRAGAFCDVPELTGGAPDLFLWTINPAYRNEHRPDRKGVCYIVRKGSHKVRIPETEIESAVQVDGLSHAEMNEVFNRCETFYSYDEATMYSQYAALCGCTSVVVPGLFGSRAEWVKHHKLARLGVAYGTSPEELEHARSTRDGVEALLQQEMEAGINSVRNFIRLTREQFSGVR
jgi:hypothetical protein